MKPCLLIIILFCCTCVLAQEKAPQPNLGEANRLRAQGRLDEAQKAYEQALGQARNDNERAQALLGMANIDIGRNRSQAIASYRRVIALPQAVASFRQTAWRQIAALARNGGDSDTAREAYQHLIGDFPDDQDSAILATLELARLDLEEDNAKVAIETLQKLLKTAAKSRLLPDIYVSLAQTYAQSGHIKTAVETARAGWKLFPDRTDLMIGVAGALEQAGNLAEAAGIIQELLVLKPREQDLFRTLYELDKQLGRLPALTAWLDKQVQANPLDITWLGHLAQLYEWENDAPGALRVCEKIVKREPTDARVLQDAGQAALKAKDYGKAARWLEQALASEPNNQALVVLNGEVQLQQGHTEQALALWKQGLKYNPRDRQSVLTLGNILSRYDLDQEAVKLYTEARQASGDERAYAINLGQAYENLSEVPAAVKEYALALQGGVSQAAANLSRLAEDDLARPALLQALEGLKASGGLAADGLATLVYAQVLQGDDPQTALQALSPDKPQLLPQLLGRLASRLETAGHSDLAAACYERLLKEPLSPDYAAGVALHVAELKSQQGDWSAALVALAPLKADALQPEIGASVALQRGELLLRRAHRPADALREFNEVIELQPDSPLALKARWGEADVAFSLGKYDLALTAYHTLLEQSGGGQGLEDAAGAPQAGFASRPRRMLLPGEDYVQYQEAEALFRQGKDEEAAEAFRKFAATHAASAYANDALERVVLLRKLQGNPPGAAEYREALTAFDRGDAARAETLLGGIKSPPLADAALLFLGQALLWEGKKTEAVAALDQLPAQDATSPLAPQATYFAAMAFYPRHKGDTCAEMQKRLEALVAAYPTSPQAEQAKLVLENLRRQAAK